MNTIAPWELKCEYLDSIGISFWDADKYRLLKI